MDKWRGSEPAQLDDNDKAWGVLKDLVTHSLKEQKRARRWGVFFKLLTFSWLLFLAGGLYKFAQMDAITPSSYESHTALIELEGGIGGQVSADTIVTGLRAAFKDAATKAVVLRINSPGGSPVQSGYIYDEIVRLRQLHPGIPLYAVISDVGASGAYYVASAADKIYANRASLVGSIGVISSGFGFVEAMDKLGVTRRAYTAGEHKAFMDPFQPMDADAAKHWQASLDTIHQQFIDSVKYGRGDRLASDANVFSGMVWTGARAQELGLIDGLGSAGYVAREVVGVEDIVDFTPQPTPFERITRRFGVSVSETMVRILGLDGLQLR